MIVSVRPKATGEFPPKAGTDWRGMSVLDHWSQVKLMREETVPVASSWSSACRALKWTVENSFNSMLEQECISFLYLILLTVQLLQRNEVRE